MTAKRDYYEVLGISRTATAVEIKRAYRELARKYHPDVNRSSDADGHFKEINEAYEILSDEARRRAYDQYGHEGLNGGAGFGPGMGGFGDIFDIFFGGMGRGGGRGPTMAVRGDDLRHNLEISLEEAARGADKTVRFGRMESCDVCEGTGASPGTAPEPCPVCRGAGYVRHTQNTLLGTFQTQTTCGRCRGVGSVVQTPCEQCHGGGRMRKTRDRALHVPAGVDSGSRIRLSGEGDAGAHGGVPGDLYVVIYVKPHEVFERRENDLYCEAPISFARAALGGEITVPTIEGEERITIPAGTQTGESFRLRGKGIPDLSGRGRGDQHVVARVEVPKSLTADQKQLLEQLAASFGETIEAAPDKSFLGRIFGRD